MALRFNSQSLSVILVAPRNQTAAFGNVCSDSVVHGQLLEEMQRLRGSIYMRDGAIRTSDLSADGRHHLPVDDKSWHLLLMNKDGHVAGCARYLVHPSSVRFRDLAVATSAVARCSEWAAKFQIAVESELRASRQMGLPYVEMGGWAMGDHFRGTSQCLRSILASYAFVRLIRGALAICPATERNGCASILTRMGGRLVDAFGIVIPPYFDPGYGCRMQMLRFDAQRRLPRYEQDVQQLMAGLMDAPVICADVPVRRGPVNEFVTIPSAASNLVGTLARAC